MGITPEPLLQCFRREETRELFSVPLQESVCAGVADIELYRGRYLQMMEGRIISLDGSLA